MKQKYKLNSLTELFKYIFNSSNRDIASFVNLFYFIDKIAYKLYFEHK